ncbi:MAG: hypothetical protein WC764_04630 [Candidatus Paceibacterota bacterium]|jgi:hypothetical protein
MPLHSDKLVEICKAAHKVAYEVVTGEVERGMLAAALLTRALEYEEPNEVQSSLLEYVREQKEKAEANVGHGEGWPEPGEH